MLVSFELTMPNVGSWNGKWTGAENKYYVIKTMPERFIKHHYSGLIDLLIKPYKNWYYNFGDGWGANVRAEIIDSKEARKRRKVSRGFCGYEWMINSIITDGIIKSE